MTDDSDDWVFECAECHRQWINPGPVITKCSCGGRVVVRDRHTVDSVDSVPGANDD